MKKMVMVALLLSLYLCIIPTVAADCKVYQSLDYTAVPSQVTVGSDITFTLQIGGTSDYHYTCWVDFSPYLLHKFYTVEYDKASFFVNYQNIYQGDMLQANYPYKFIVKASSLLYPRDKIGSSVSCIAYNEPGAEDECYAVIDPVYAESVIVGTPIPEFPSTILPITMIIGFLGAVLLIQRTREH